MTRIPLLATLITGLKAVCVVIDKASGPVRFFVPEANQAAYDEAIANIVSACNVIRAIDFVDNVAGTTPLWGAK